MAKEERLIDGNKAQAVLVNMAEHLKETGNLEMAGVVGYAAEVIGKQPTMDAVEVVRCKECKWFRKGKPFRHECKKVGGGMFYPSPDDFCSYGERREGK